jgi:polyhydroxybutyrate depolymerase
MLHGEHSDATHMQQMAGLDQTVGAAGNYLVYPNGPGQSWNAGGCCNEPSKYKFNDIRFLDAVIALVRVDYPTIPDNKIAMGGFSAGGMMAFRYACDGRTHITQILSVAGVPLQYCVQVPSASVLAINGVVDNIVLWAPKNTRPLFTRVTGSTQNLVECFAGLLGSWYWNYGTPTAPGDLRRNAGGVLPGYTMQSIVGKRLDHRWTRTAAEQQEYGINATTEVTNWVLANW